MEACVLVRAPRLHSHTSPSSLTSLPLPATERSPSFTNRKRSHLFVRCTLVAIIPEHTVRNTSCTRPSRDTCMACTKRVQGQLHGLSAVATSLAQMMGAVHL
ncbi:hypothetical protein STCU_11524 [Strigomonas culicis]|uniref:Uncharacterized protein n=1 Tax=Strigomonas culicis TaxID=28005 RepID=S9TGX3_9TRYP|nr:hypothetical protein STCU_11524 [Strigomonas culicis]|eukprot:EPY16139.1 hypothetical protein STCU_11524 [Strigomonas culicis]